jgi:aryl-alcohol dehydrogenase-like predicted oxidoreductase
MDMRELGRSGLKIAPLVFGGNVFGWTIDEATSFTLLDAFVDAGLNAIDTADVYSRWIPGHQGGESETIIGKWLKANPGKRDRIVLMTKFGLDVGNGKGLSARQMVTAVEASLTRLQTDVIDLYQAHRFDPDTPHEETLAAFARLIEAGKVRAIGASNYTADELSAALATSADHGLPRYETLQPLYNLYDRGEYEGPLRDLCLAETIGTIPYYALAAGFLTGKYRSAADTGKSSRGGGMGQYLNDRGFRILAALDDVSARLGATQAEVALAWLIAREGVTAPIASATSLAQLQGLINSVSLVLPAEDIVILDQAGS